METSTSLGLYEKLGLVEKFETGNYEMLFDILDEFRISKHLPDPYYAFILTDKPLERVKMVVHTTPEGVLAHSLVVIKVDGEVVGEILYEGILKVTQDVFNKHELNYLNHTEGLDAFNEFELVRSLLLAVTEEYAEALRKYEW